MSSLFRALLAPAALLLGSSAAGQSVLHVFDGDSGSDFLGSSVDGAGDVDADGHPDLIVGAPGDAPGGIATGSARVCSGLDGSTLFTLLGDAGADKFGIAVAGAGDVDADGHADLIVGAPGSDANGADAGRARVFSGLDGSVLHTFDGDAPGDGFGGSVSGAGDVNGDGYDDVVVGASRAGADSGFARVFSGLDGAILYTFDAQAAGDMFGASVSGAGDVNGDGYDDVVVGALFSDVNGTSSGSALVFSGADGSTLHAFFGDSKGDQLGNAVSDAGDVDGDSFSDVIVGIRNDDNNGQNSGSARVFSGVDGTVLYTFDGDGPGLGLGRAVSGAGDVNGDGYADLLVGETHLTTSGTTKGSTRVFSGLDGSDVWKLVWSTPADSFGRAVAAAGDVNLDGFADVIVGDSHDSVNGVDGGSAIVFSGRDGLGTSYCGPAVPNSSGSPGVLTAFGSAVVADDLFFLSANDLPVGKFGYFITSENQGFVQGPGGSQGNLCLAGQIGRYVKQVEASDAAGRIELHIELGDLPPPIKGGIQPGDTWNFQTWYRDNNPTPTSNFTDAVSVTFG